MADTKISALPSGAPAQAGDEYVVARSGANYKLTLTNIAANMPATTIASGNLTFSSTGQRITGDMSNATATSRLAFQSSTTNGNTIIQAIPNGTATQTNLLLYANTDLSNTAALNIFQNATESTIRGIALGTGSYTPLTFYTGGGERMRLDTSGNLGIGGTPTVKWQVFDTNKVTNNPGNAAIYTTTAQGADVGGQLSLGGLYTASDYAPFAAIAGRKSDGTSGTTNGYMALSVLSSGTITERMRIDSSGNVGIGLTSPSAKLDIAGDVFITKGSSPLFCTGDNQVLRIGVNQAESMRITTAGEVYIAGTTDQGAYNLQCNGTGVWGAGAYVNGSDARLKDNIQSLDSGLDVVKAMRPVTFQYKPEYSKDQSVQPGFIAQELQTAMAGKAYLEGVVQEGPNHLNVAYQNIIPILVKAIQELEAKVAALEAK